MMDMPERPYPYVPADNDFAKFMRERYADIARRNEDDRKQLESLTILRDRLPELRQYCQTNAKAIEVIEKHRFPKRQIVAGIMGGWVIGSYYRNPDRNRYEGGYIDVLVSEYGDLVDPTPVDREGVTVMVTEMPKFSVEGLLKANSFMHTNPSMDRPDVGAGIRSVLGVPSFVASSIEYHLRVPDQQR